MIELDRMSVVDSSQMLGSFASSDNVSKLAMVLDNYDNFVVNFVVDFVVVVLDAVVDNKVVIDDADYCNCTFVVVAAGVDNEGDLCILVTGKLAEDCHDSSSGCHQLELRSGTASSRRELPIYSPPSHLHRPRRGLLPD